MHAFSLRLRLLLCPIALILVVTACRDGPTEPGAEPELAFQVSPHGPLDVGVGDQVPLQVVVRSDGDPLAEASVEWEVVGGEGSVEPGSSLTDDAGRANASWHVGTVAGSGALMVRVQGAGEETVQATILPGAAETLASVPDTVRLQARRARGTPAVAFHDRYGNETSVPSDLNWEVEDPSVASVEEDGRLAAGAEGVTVLHLSSSIGGATIPVRVTHDGAITVTFDDGFRSVHQQAFPILADLGLRANVAIVTRAVEEEWPDFLDFEQLTELHDAGWAVASHSVTHARLDSIPLNEVHRELDESRAWIEAHGFRGGGVFVVPYHVWNEPIRQAVAEHYTLARGRGIWKGAPETKAEWIPEDRMDLGGLDVDWYGLESDEELDWLRAVLQRTVDEGLYFELYFHRVEEEQVEVFTRIVEVIAEFRDHVRTFDELLSQAEGTGP